MELDRLLVVHSASTITLRVPSYCPLGSDPLILSGGGISYFLMLSFISSSYVSFPYQPPPSKTFPRTHTVYSCRIYALCTYSVYEEYTKTRNLIFGYNHRFTPYIFQEYLLLIHIIAIDRRKLSRWGW